MYFLFILIICFVIFMIFGIYENMCVNKMEGLTNIESNNTTPNEYQPYNLSEPNNALILAQQNAGNINVLKGEIDDIKKLKSQVDTLQSKTDVMSGQIQDLVTQQQSYAQNLVGSEQPNITGTTEEENVN